MILCYHKDISIWKTILYWREPCCTADVKLIGVYRENQLHRTNNVIHNSFHIANVYDIKIPHIPACYLLKLKISNYCCTSEPCVHSDGVKHVAYCWRISGLVHLDLLHLDLSKNLKFLGLRKRHSKSLFANSKLSSLYLRKYSLDLFPLFKTKSERTWMGE